MSEGRRTLLAEKAHGFCSLLTPHGRKRSLGFNVDFDEGGSIPPDDPRLPQTCEQEVRRQWHVIHREERDPATRGDASWPRDLRRSRFSVTWIRGKRAKVQLKVAVPFGPVAHFWLRHTHCGWRVDDSDIVPVGH